LQDNATHKASPRVRVGYEEIKSFHDRLVVPKSLYHYTSAAGLLGILKTESIFATEQTHLNDASEYKYAVDLIEDLMRKSSFAHLSSEAVDVLVMNLRLFSTPAFNVRSYITSFTCAGDVLSQWIMYAGATGYCIDLDPEVLFKEIQKISGIIVPVFYKLEIQREILNETLTKMDERLAIALSIGNESVTEWYGTSLATLTTLAQCMKHHGFAQEEEVRVICTVDPDGTHVPKFRAGRHGATPYLSLPIRPDGEWAIKGLRSAYSVYPGSAEVATSQLIRAYELGEGVMPSMSVIPIKW
jgi:hypothetical protein